MDPEQLILRSFRHQLPALAGAGFRAIAPMMRGYQPSSQPADRDYQGGFAAALMLKDLRLAMEAAASAGANTPMGARAAELYEQFVDAGHGTTDFSGIIKTL